MIDEKFAIANPAPSLTDRQVRFLDALIESRLNTTVAARLAGIHRTTVYLWLRQPAFVAARKATAEAFFAACRAEALEWQAARRLARDDRVRDPGWLAAARRRMAYARSCRRQHRRPPHWGPPAPLPPWAADPADPSPDQTPPTTPERNVTTVTPPPPAPQQPDRLPADLLAAAGMIDPPDPDDASSRRR